MNNTSLLHTFYDGSCHEYPQKDPLTVVWYHSLRPVSWPQIGLQLIYVFWPDARMILSRVGFEQWQVFDWEIEMHEPLQNCG